MAKRIDLVAVGIDRTKVLTQLSGAASGASDFADWLKDQEKLGARVNTTVLTDANGASIEARDVQNAVQAVVDARACDLLILYFAGHGIVKSGGDEQVLMSKIADYNDEAIDIAATAFNARFCGIKHVLIISDACRSPVTYGAELSQVSGKPAIKHSDDLDRPKTEVDVYYATAPSRTAKEYKGVGFFTSMMISALTTCPPQIQVNSPDYEEGRAVVPSNKLAKYLEDVVPVEASLKIPPFDQRPDIIVSSHEPKFVAYAPYTTKKGAAPLITPMTEQVILDRSHPALVQADALRNIARSYVGGGDRVRLGLEMAGIGNDYLETDVDPHRRASFETRTGYIVVGARVDKVLIWGPEPDILPTNEGSDVRLFPATKDSPFGNRGSMLVMFKGGTCSVVPVIPGYIGTLGIEGGLVRRFSFEFSDLERHYYGISDLEMQEMAQRRAAAAGLAANGALWRLAKGDATNIAEFVRQGKRIDPTLGVFSAYAYFTAGQDDGVKSVFDWMSGAYADRPSDLLVAPVPFDVAMLAGEVNRENALGMTKPAGFAPFCPMLTLGWSLLAGCTRKVPLHHAIYAAGKHRLNAEWTTFRRKDVRPLIKAFESGEIL